MPGPPVLDRAALVLLGLAAALFAWLLLVLHRTPGYGVETDLVGEYLPQARDLLHGRFDASAYASRGPVYPAVVALAAALTRGDLFLAARWVNLVAAVAAAAAAWVLVRTFAGRLVALATAAGIVGMPVFLNTVVDCGTDLAALALMLAATAALLDARPRSAALAGLLAAAAILTRPAALALLPAGAITLAVEPAARRRLLAWGLAAGIPLVLWTLFLAAHGVPIGGARDALNMAYEFHGRTRGWELFWSDPRNASAFRSVVDVVRVSPARFFAHLGFNLATRWATDAVQLMPPAIGVFALPGLALLVVRGRHRVAFAAHFLCAYVALAFVFYTPRFFLYLLPFELAGAVALGFRGAGAVAGRLRPGLRRPAVLVATVVAAIVLGLAFTRSLAGVRAALAEAPVEARSAGEQLRAIARPGESLMARKPHAAFFAGVAPVPLPAFERFTDLLAAARRTRATYLLVSPIELGLRPRLRFLADRDITLPGLRPVLWEHGSDRHFFAVYRFTNESVPDSVFQDSLVAVLAAFAKRRPGDPRALVQFGQELVIRGRAAAGLRVLEVAEGMAPSDPEAVRQMVVALAALGRDDDAIDALDRLPASSDVPWRLGFTGRLRMREGRIAEARALLDRAVAAAPADPQLLADQAAACARSGDWSAAADASERALRLDPTNDAAAALAAEARKRLGRRERATTGITGNSPDDPTR